jgi:hypothetical protein
MSKHFILSLIFRDGKRGAIAADNSAALITLARSIRDAGAHDKRAVAAGAVLSSVRGVMMRFACKPKPVAEKTTPKGGG